MLLRADRRGPYRYGAGATRGTVGGRAGGYEVGPRDRGIERVSMPSGKALVVKSDVLELLPELVELVVLGLTTTGLSLAGTYIERFALTTLQSGDTALGLWAAFFGGVVLLFAFRIGTDKFITKLADFRAVGSDPSE